MHVHRPPIDLGVADLYAAQAAKKAAEAKKAADVRRKLLRASASIDGEFVSLSINERSGQGSRQGSGDGQEQGFAVTSTRSGKAVTSARRAVADPLSIWA